MPSDTIYALSSAPGRAGVAVIRVSGKDARAALEKIGGVFSPTPRKAILTALRYPEDSGAQSRLREAQSSRAQKNEEIDHALVIFFEAPASFTGEDVAEFHVHGGGAVVRALCDALSVCGCRMAQAGEFTRRAFDNGKLDLAEVEGLADLINAETEAQRKQALAQMDGALSQATDEWRLNITKIMAYCEAGIDFPDEDLPAHVTQEMQEKLAALRDEIAGELAGEKRGEILRSGFRVALVGAPNAGKSSLLNLLARREAAIVSPLPGTTRDVVEVHLDLGGWPVILSDTAGLRDTDGAIEVEGIARARRAAEAAHLKLVLFDAAEEPDAASLALLDENAIAVVSKIDLMENTSSQRKLGSSIEQKTLDSGFRRNDVVSVSARTGEGLPALLSAISERLRALTETGANQPLLTRERHAEALRDTLACLTRALKSLAAGKPAELTAEELRLASRALARVTGEVDVEDLLDVIFRDFCIGK